MVEDSSTRKAKIGYCYWEWFDRRMARLVIEGHDGTEDLQIDIPLHRKLFSWLTVARTSTQL